MQVFSPTTPLIGVGLKMYKSHGETLQWLAELVTRIAPLDAIAQNRVQLFVLPGFVALADAQRILEGTGIGLGAQDMYCEDSGAYTGEVSARDLVDVGCSYVEVAHMERRTLFGESDELISQKVAQAFRHNLVPIICVGETDQTDPRSAAKVCLGQVDAFLDLSRAEGLSGQMVLAYEPYWAIGASEPAPVEYINGVNRILGEALGNNPDSVVIYGGSAGPGMFEGIYPTARGLFLGRSAHNLDNVEAIIREADQAASA